MVRLTCLLKRKPGMTPAAFHDHWRNQHGPLVASSRSGSHVLRYEQHPKPMHAYRGDEDTGYDGVTMQWYESMAAYEASLAEDDFAVVMEDLATFLDLDHLDFVVTEETIVVMDGLGGNDIG